MSRRSLERKLCGGPKKRTANKGKPSYISPRTSWSMNTSGSPMATPTRCLGFSSSKGPGTGVELVRLCRFSIATWTSRDRPRAHAGPPKPRSSELSSKALALAFLAQSLGALRQGKKRSSRLCQARSESSPSRRGGWVCWRVSGFRA